jgi:hypothetical protein
MLWPRKREDGSMSVAARFAAPTDAQTAAVRRVLADWNTRKAVTDELVSQPYVVVMDAETIDVVAEVRLGSWGWKYILGALADRIDKDTDATFEGYVDRVSEVFRAAGRLGWRAIDEERWGVCD